MATRTEAGYRFRLRSPEGRSAAALRPSDSLVAGAVAGVLGGLVFALPLILWDWVKSSHIALEVTTATTAWLFGLDHFSRTDYRLGPIVVGAVFMIAYWIVSGLTFAGIADRVSGIRTLGGSIAAGAAWSFVSFIFFWYMLLPIARDGAPFRETAVAPGQFVAPNWVWILAFTVSGLATSISYAALRNPMRSMENMGSSMEHMG